MTLLSGHVDAWHNYSGGVNTMRIVIRYWFALEFVCHARGVYQVTSINTLHWCSACTCTAMYTQCHSEAGFRMQLRLEQSASEEIAGQRRLAFMLPIERERERDAREIRISSDDVFVARRGRLQMSSRAAVTSDTSRVPALLLSLPRVRHEEP